MDQNAPIASGNQRLFNNPNKSDIRFLIDDQTLYGHKQVLAKGSPVFESMFFGELREQREVIEIEDLTLVGFKNALRFIYGFKIDFDLSELYESYMAADKYLLNNFSEAFLDYIKSKLNAENSCLVYEQLLKTGNPEENSFARVRRTIIKNSKKAFESEHFTQIDQETLISLLSLDELSIAEFDLLAAVCKWVDCEVQRRALPVNGENRRRVFEPIKGYVLFSELSAEKFARCKEMVELIAPEEVGLLFLHLLNEEHHEENQLPFEQKTWRVAGASTCRVFASSFSFSYDDYDNDHEEDYNVIDMYLTADRGVSIRTIHTTYSERFDDDLHLVIYDLDRKQLNIDMYQFVKDGKLSFSLDPPFELQPDCSYRLVASSDEWIDEVSEENLDYKEQVHFTVERESANCFECHCIRGLEFSILD